VYDRGFGAVTIFFHYLRTNRNNSSFRSGNGRRGGTRWGRSRYNGNNYSNTKNRKRFYGTKNNSDAEKTNDNKNSAPKKGTGGRGRGRGRGRGKQGKKSS
jgi:hypothetical protein